MKMQQMKTTRHAPFCQRVSTRSIVCKAAAERSSPRSSAAAFAGCMAAGLSAAAINLLVVNLAHAEFRLPPIGNDPDRCDRGYVGNTIGQANAVSDKLLDLRQCSFKGADLHGRVLAGGLMSDADFSGTNMQEAVLTKAYAVKANFEGADLTNAVVDRVDFSGANLKGVKFINTVVTGAQFLGAQLDGSIWEDALIGSQDVGKLCENPTLTGESRMQVGCRVVKK